VTADTRIAREARVLRLRLELGLVSLREIEIWAEQILISVIEPPYEFVELAMSNVRGRKATESTLRAVTVDAVTASDVLAALAAADTIDWPSHRIVELADALRMWAYQLDEDSEAGRLLFAADNITDEFNTPPEWNYVPDMNRARKMLVSLIDEAREVAAKPGSGK